MPIHNFQNGEILKAEHLQSIIDSDDSKSLTSLLNNINNINTKFSNSISVLEDNFRKLNDNFNTSTSYLKKILSQFKVGSIYITQDPTNPTYIFGGTWELIKDSFLLGAGGLYPINTTGGKTTHSHSLDAMAEISFRSGNTISIDHYQRGDEWEADATVGVSGRGTDTQPFKDGARIIGIAETATLLPPYMTVYIWRCIEAPVFKDIPPISTKNTHSVYVKDGNATPNFAEKDAFISLTAHKKNGYTFTKWTTSTFGVTIQNETSSDNAYFTMPDNDVNITANYKKTTQPKPEMHKINVTDGTATPPQAEQGTQVRLNANEKIGYKFNRWTTSSNISIWDSTSPTSAYFSMPNNDVQITATYTEIQAPTKYSITVSGGYADPRLATQGTTITITAQAPSGQKFSYWTADPSVNFGNQSAATTTFPMPASDVNITAHFVASGGGDGGGINYTKEIAEYFQNEKREKNYSSTLTTDSGGSQTLKIQAPLSLSGSTTEFYNNFPLWPLTGPDMSIKRPSSITFYAKATSSDPQREAPRFGVSATDGTTDTATETFNTQQALEPFKNSTEFNKFTIVPKLTDNSLLIAMKYSSDWNPTLTHTVWLKDITYHY